MDLMWIQLACLISYSCPECESFYACEGTDFKAREQKSQVKQALFAALLSQAKAREVMYERQGSESLIPRY